LNQTSAQESPFHPRLALAPAGIFTKDAKMIANAMASQKVSPKGLGFGIRMVQFFINRAGKEPAAQAEARTGRSQATGPGEGP
jgi:hypothetical protein